MMCLVVHNPYIPHPACLLQTVSLFPFFKKLYNHTLGFCRNKKENQSFRASTIAILICLHSSPVIWESVLDKFTTMSLSPNRPSKKKKKVLHIIIWFLRTFDQRQIVGSMTNQQTFISFMVEFYQSPHPVILHHHGPPTDCYASPSLIAPLSSPNPLHFPLSHP